MKSNINQTNNKYTSKNIKNGQINCEKKITKIYNFTYRLT